MENSIKKEDLFGSQYGKLCHMKKKLDANHNTIFWYTIKNSLILFNKYACLVCTEVTLIW